VVAYEVAEIRPQVTGIVQSRLFEEGTYVAEGQQLYQIDPARFEADYQMARANLEEAEAQLENARLLAERFGRLVDDNTVSRQQYDDAVSRLNQAKAAVSLANAEVQRAKIDLEYTQVRSPISGYIGTTRVTRGALVTALQETPLATVRQLDPIYVDLTQTASEARLLRERLRTHRAEEDKTMVFSVALFLDDASGAYQHRGQLDATDLAVDPRTGAIRLRSVFKNPDRELLPGMFVRASVAEAGESREILVPQKSVNIEPSGRKSVWLVGDNNQASKRMIRTGAAYGSNWIVLNGLETGEKLIVEGRMNLREGAPVKPEQLDGFYDGLDQRVPPSPLRRSAPPPLDPEPEGDSEQASSAATVRDGPDNS
jgi:membrane fusion protein (multidrug efflux system)